MCCVNSVSSRRKKSRVDIIRDVQREKQIERVIKNTVGLYGDMQGIIGGQIPTIDALELESKALVEAPANED